MTLTRPVCAVRMCEDLPSSGVLTRIPEDSDVEISGPSRFPRMVEIRWNGDVYSVFQTDLAERCLEAEQYT